ncbi:hypothetical protein GUJ93_ZPchr0005g15121 [Zizania palustris]|uniref:Uncharacterized protein n=1 Tax=Zizania palustris TaxID=103762 RepID=A0A8J5VQA4_ZIZPA|nr:hypothetical protein GUJ93_ZPchr0005g15121 [Zizania palustris]
MKRKGKVSNSGPSSRNRRERRRLDGSNSTGSEEKKTGSPRGRLSRGGHADSACGPHLQSSDNNARAAAQCAPPAMRSDSYPNTSSPPPLPLSRRKKD